MRFTLLKLFVDLFLSSAMVFIEGEAGQRGRGGMELER